MVATAQAHAVQPQSPTDNYSVTCSWSGSTGAGHERYSRAHLGHALPAGAVVRLSADPAHDGDPARLSAEQLLVLAAASGQLLAFLAAAARAGIDVRDYQDAGHAVMTEDGGGDGRIVEITLRPRITVVTDATEDRLRQLTDLAHERSRLAASLVCPVTVEPTFEILTPYAFRDTEAAALRLGVVAEVFDPGSRAFVAAHAPTSTRPTLAVDLGCGPGHTTRLVASATGARRTAGLDTSEAFLTAASSFSSPARAGDASPADPDTGGAGEIEFLRHDVRQIPFPTRARAADVVYARHLLSHLADATDAIGGWISQVAPRGVLLLDEIESIDTDQPALAAYLDHATHLLAARGTTLHAGELLNTALHDLAGHQPTPEFEIEYDATEELSPPVTVAATMFAMNLAVWRADPLFRDRQAELDQLAADLAALASAPSDDAGRITWTLRRVAVRRLDR